MAANEYICERFEILKKSGLITEQAVVQVKKILELLEEQGWQLDEEKLVMFTTHMAMALQRIVNGQYEEPLDRAILESMKTEKTYPKARTFAKKIKEAVNVELPEVEEEYILVHLCSLFS